MLYSLTLCGPIAGPAATNAANGDAGICQRQKNTEIGRKDEKKEGGKGGRALEREEDGGGGGGGVKEGVAGCHVMPACENGGTRGTKVPRESAAAERQFRDVAVTVSRFDASVSR